MLKRIIGWLLLAAAALILVSQIVADSPWQAGVALGILLLIVGGCMVVDSPAGTET